MSSNGAELPQEVVVDILSRLPVKSLCRFKCVSNTWHSLISDSHFAKTHLNRNNNNTRERLILISNKSLYSIDCTEASKNDAVIATRIDFPPIEDSNELIEILGSCNGLLLVVNEVDWFLLNPSTREFKKLPKSPFSLSLPWSHSMYGLGYDSSADDYKFVTVMSHAREDDNHDISVIVYSLKTSSWRRIQDVPYYNSLLDPSLLMLVLVNGSLHWLTFRSSDQLSHSYSSVIAAFDVADEKFRDVPAPSSLENHELEFYELGVFGGCLCMSIETDVWVMMEYGVTESWIKITIDVPKMHMMEPLCFLVDGEVLQEIYGNKLVAFNAKVKTSRDMHTYVESLVSPYYDSEIERKYKGNERLQESSTR